MNIRKVRSHHMSKQPSGGYRVISEEKFEPEELVLLKLGSSDSSGYKKVLGLIYPYFENYIVVPLDNPDTL